MNFLHIIITYFPFSDRVWPVPSDFIPYDIFLNQYHIVMDLNKGRKTEFVKEDIPQDESFLDLQNDIDTGSQRGSIFSNEIEE